MVSFGRWLELASPLCAEAENCWPADMPTQRAEAKRHRQSLPANHERLGHRANYIRSYNQFRNKYERNMSSAYDTLQANAHVHRRSFVFFTYIAAKTSEEEHQATIHHVLLLLLLNASCSAFIFVSPKLRTNRCSSFRNASSAIGRPYLLTQLFWAFHSVRVVDSLLWVR